MPRVIGPLAPLDTLVYECPNCDAKLAMRADSDPGESMAEIAKFQKNHECVRTPKPPPPYEYNPACTCIACVHERMKRERARG